MGRREYHSWFPIANSQIMDPEFRLLTPTQKLYYWYLVGEYNYYMAELGEYYRSDQWFASAINVKERTIREARRECQKKGFIETQPGYYNFKTGQAVATKYKYVKWADPSELTGGYAKFKRHHIGMLAQRIRRHSSPINVSDVVVYIYLDFLRDRYRDNDFYVSKRELREMTRIKKAPESVRNLYEGFEFNGGSHLFEYDNIHHKFLFKKWAEAAEPYEEDQAYKNALDWENGIRDHVENARNMVKRKEEQKLRAKGEAEGTVYSVEDLPDYFISKYKEFHEKAPNIGYGQKNSLIEISKKYPPQHIADLIDFYFVLFAEDVPNFTGSQYRTLSNFIYGFDEILGMSHGALVKW